MVTYVFSRRLGRRELAATAAGNDGADAGPRRGRATARTLLSGLAVVLASALLLPGGATAAVSTDQPSYEPGATVTVSGDNSDGAGYGAGEEVVVGVTGPEEPAGTGCTAVADANGAWSCQFTLAGDASAVGGYEYTATGQSSGVVQSGSFTDSGCPNSHALGNQKEDPQVRATVATSGSTATYSFKSPSDSPVGGVPGLIEYCVYTSPLPSSETALYSNLHGAWTAGAGGGFFDFERSGGNPDNVPFDGSTQQIGEATWSGSVPSAQTIVLHINDSSECSLLYGAGTESCFVLPGKDKPVAKDPTVEKTAEPALTRTYAWSISKAVDRSESKVAAGESAEFKYTVSVSHDEGTDSGWTVTGKISVANPNPAAVTGVDVTDVLSDANANCAVSGGSGATLAAASTTEFDYTCTYSAEPSSSAETNHVTVEWPTQELADETLLSSGSTEAQAAVDWASASVDVVDGTTAVSDSMVGALGTASYTDASPKQFSYTRTFTDPAGMCTTHPNTATQTTQDSGTTSSAGQSVKNCVAEACHVLKGAGHIPPKGLAGVNFNDNLGTCAGAKEVLGLTWENGTKHLTLKTPRTVTMTRPGPGEVVFSGHGAATVNLVKGYEITFRFTYKESKWSFILQLEKQGVVLQEWRAEPILEGKQILT